MLEALDEGFCVIKLAFDAAGRPSDYRFLQVNPAFEAQTGLTGAVGRWMSELAPGHAPGPAPRPRWAPAAGGCAGRGP